MDFGLVILTSYILQLLFEQLQALGLSGTPVLGREHTKIKREFDPGSESTLAACLTHASRTRKGLRP